MVPAVGVLRDLVTSTDGLELGKRMVVERTAKVHAVYGAFVFLSLMIWPKW